jgi:hypothetical protein
VPCDADRAVLFVGMESAAIAHINNGPGEKVFQLSELEAVTT